MKKILVILHLITILNILLMNVSASDNFLKPAWVAYYGGDQDELGGKIIENDGSLYVLSGFFNRTSESSKLILLKYNLDGKMQWNSTWENEKVVPHGFTIYQNSIYVTGSTQSPLDQNFDVFLLRYNLDGHLIWSKTWDGIGSFGRPSFDEGRAVSVSDGYIYIVGTTTSNAPSLNKQYVNVMKYDLDGTLLWQRSIGPDNIYVYGYCSACNENYQYIYGRFTDLRNPTSRVDGLIVYRLDRNWDLLSNKTMGWPNVIDHPGSILVLNGSIYLSGNTLVNGEGAPFLFKFDQYFNQIWNATWVKSDATGAVYGKIIEIDSQLHLFGFEMNSTGSYIQLFRYSEDGILLNNWVWGNGGDTGHDLCYFDGAMYLVGSTSVHGIQGRNETTSNIFLMKINVTQNKSSTSITQFLYDNRLIIIIILLVLTLSISYIRYRRSRVRN